MTKSNKKMLAKFGETNYIRLVELIYVRVTRKI
jgi:hypothetical protein